MRVLLINTTELGGGAAIATTRLKEALIDNGIKAKMLVAHKESRSLSVVGITALKHKNNFLKERLGVWTTNGFSRKHLFDVDTAAYGSDITSLPEFKEADVIHLNWINQGFLSLKGIRKILESGKPVVWTLHDMWEFTGVCHYAADCENFKAHCHDCPLLRHPGAKDLSYKVFQRKQKMLENHKINFVAVSKWLADTARSSRLLRFQPISVIPNALNLNRFQLKDREEARKKLILPEKFIIVFGAVKIDDPRKGFSYLLEALRLLINNKTFRPEDFHLVLFGGIKDPSILEDIPVDYSHLGFVKDDETLALLYAAANVTVIPSRYETFGQTVMEAQACGCVPVTFNNSGQTDIVEHKINGYLAEYLNIEDLAEGIKWAIQTHVDTNLLRSNVIRQFSETAVAGKYIELYNSISKTEA